jgi:Fic family protein
MERINNRQEKILTILKAQETLSPQQILEKLKTKKTIITISRDLSKLVKLKYIKRIGQGRNTSYLLLPKSLFFRPIDEKNYFETEIDQRKIIENFNFKIFDQLSKTTIFNPDEEKILNDLHLQFNQNYSQLSPIIINKEIERITIELSWKSSVIEGNTYSLLETERLFKEGKEAKGKKKEEAIMLLNHKKALTFIFDNKKAFKKISRPKIEEIHKIITQNLNVTNNLRKTLVGITGTKFKPIDNQFQIIEAIENFCQLVNNIPNFFTKSFLSIILLSYIQPFEDGNKRTSRILGNTFLLANNSFPLPLRSVDEDLYKKATLLFYEQNNLTLFKKIFIDQCSFSVNNYFKSKID